MTRRGAFLAGLAATTLAPRVARAQSAATIHIGAALDDQSTPLLYAQHAGLFQKAGLDVQIARMSSGAAIAAAVAGGSLQIGKASMMNLVTAHARALPFTLVAPAGLYRGEAPDGGLIVGAHANIRTAKDLNGKIIAVASLNDLNAIATQEWIDQQGGDARSVRFIELVPSAVGVALEQQRIDGATLWNPVMADAIASGKARMAAGVFDAIAKRYQVAAWFADGGWAAKNRATVEHFAAVMHEANAYVAAHESETTTLIASFIGVDPTALARMARSMPAPYLEAREIEPVVAVAAKHNVIAHTFPAEEMISAFALRNKS